MTTRSTETSVSMDKKFVKTAEHLGIPIEDNADNLETLVNERIMKTRQAIHGSKVICSGGG